MGHKKTIKTKQFKVIKPQKYVNVKLANYGMNMGGIPDILTNLKNALISALQQTAGNLGGNFLTGLKFNVNGSINFKITDINGKIVLNMDLPIAANGDFEKHI